MLEAKGDGDSAATMFGVLDLLLDDALRRRSWRLDQIARRADFTGISLMKRRPSRL